MRAYAAFATKKFQNNMAYRFDHIMGIFNTILMFFVFWCIYKALYGGANEIDGITFSMVTTNFIISLGLSHAFSMDDTFILHKVEDGTIVNELLKPVNFKARMLSENLGDSLFKITFNFLPALLVASLFTKIEMPSSVLNLLLFMVSTLLGYLILWGISFITQILCFWLIATWGINVIKNVIINVLSGSMIPLWFMPEALMKFIRYTPFDSIYFTPVKLYLGQMQGSGILYNFGRQIIWIVIFFVIGEFLWHKGQKKLVVQGG